MIPQTADPRIPRLAGIARTLDRTYRNGYIGIPGERIPIEPVAMRLDLGLKIADVLRQSGARRTLEVGFAFGLSGLFMLHACLENGAEPGTGEPIHTAIDPLARSVWKSAGLEVFRQAGVLSDLRLVEEGSDLHLPALEREGARFDAILVDGDHRFEFVFLDILHGSRMLEDGGLLIVDDLWMPSVRAAVEYFTTNMGFEVEELCPVTRHEGLVVLRKPVASPKRLWNHYVPFDAGLGSPVAG